jgi:predicted MFS family arabinose efflux permease
VLKIAAFSLAGKSNGSRDPETKLSGRADGVRGAFLTALTRFAQTVFGEDVEPELRAVLASAFASSLAFSAFWSFVGIWAIDELGASSAQLGVAFLLDALAAAMTGYLGGQLSDRVGRRPVMLAAWSGQALVALAFLLVGDRVFVGLGLIVLSAGVGSPAISAGQAIVADLVPPERHEPAYASLRVALNLGVVAGPPLAGALLLGERWDVFFVGVAILATCAALLGVRFLPARGRYAPAEPPSRRSFTVIRSDRVFLLFLVSTVLAYVVYFAFETVLPISIVQTYGLSPAAWGFLVVINPVLVTLFQLRLTRSVRCYSPALKLLVAMPLMGFPFLLLSVNASVAVIVIVLVVFVVGEMLWAPTSQAIAARMSPEDVRGAYMGAFGSASATGFALGPLAGLQLRGAAGDTVMWGFYAAAAAVAAVAGAVACRTALGRRGLDG